MLVRRAPSRARRLPGPQRLGRSQVLGVLAVQCVAGVLRIPRSAATSVCWKPHLLTIGSDKDVNLRRRNAVETKSELLHEPSSAWSIIIFAVSGLVRPASRTWFTAAM